MADCLLELDDIKTWSFAGDIGDMLAFLCVVKHFGLSNITFHDRTFTREAIGHRMDIIRPLLEKQSYINEVKFGEDDNAIDGDVWRDYAKWHKSIPTAMMEAFNANATTKEPWIQCDDPNPVAQVIFCRTLRYRACDVMWEKLYRMYPKAVFCGLKTEWLTMRNQCPNIEWYETKDLWELARVLKGAHIVCANPTAVYWLSVGMGVNTIHENNSQYNNCKVNMPNVHYIETNNAIELDHGELRFW